MPILGLFLYLWCLILIRVFMKNILKIGLCSIIVDHYQAAIWRDGSFYVLRRSNCSDHCDDCAFKEECSDLTEGPRLCEIIFGDQFPGFSIGVL